MNEFDVLLARKLGGSGDTYTKAQIDAMMQGKVGFSDVDSALSTTSENPVQNRVINAALTTIDSNGNIFIGGTQITQLIDQDSYDALVTKENRFYLVYPTPANNGGE